MYIIAYATHRRLHLKVYRACGGVSLASCLSFQSTLPGCTENEIPSDPSCLISLFRHMFLLYPPCSTFQAPQSHPTNNL